MMRIYICNRYLLATSWLFVSGCFLAALKASSRFFISVMLLLMVFVFSFSSSSWFLACRWITAAGSEQTKILHKKYIVLIRLRIQIRIFFIFRKLDRICIRTETWIRIRNRILSQNSEASEVQNGAVKSRVCSQRRPGCSKWSPGGSTDQWSQICITARAGSGSAWK